MTVTNLGRITGKSAYEIAVEKGFVGTEAQWLASLRGPQGVKGETGIVTDVNGVPIATALAGKASVDSVNALTAQMIQTARQTQILSSGVQVLNGETNAPVNVEFEGRTLIPMQNTPLTPLKNYVLADSKTKLKYADGTAANGVSKFIAKANSTTTANFEGKIMGSTVENPHMGFHNYLGNHTTLQPPTIKNIGNISEFAQATGYTYSQSLNGIAHATPSSLVNGAIAQQLFAFNVIEEIERKLGRIPKSTVAEKVAWLKDNVKSLVFNWHGFGSSVGGNKANIGRFLTSTNTWQYLVSNTLNSVGKLTINENSSPTIGIMIDSNGFTHYLAYAEPSNGTIASTINTDYAELIIELKPEAQLDTTPAITRVANFEGKVSGSTVENPHIAKYAYQSSLQHPISGVVSEYDTNTYPLITKLDGQINARTNSTNLAMAQQIFSFNIIEEVERNIGRIPRATLAEKVQWLKDNVKTLRGNWHGFGSIPTGNRSSFSVWILGTGWDLTSHVIGTSSTVERLSRVIGTGALNVLDTNGFVHFLAFAEPSNGTIASTINTDYVELEIELKQDAVLHDPRVPLYEVEPADYAKVLVEWNADEVVKRYPKVEGVQHLQNPYVMAEGENLLPPFTEWNLHANTVIVGSYQLDVNTTSSYQNNVLNVNVIPNSKYVLSMAYQGRISIVNTVTQASIAAQDNYATKSDKILTFTTGTTDNQITIYFTTGTISTGKVQFSNPMLTLGTTPKPFTPRNPSYLYADVKLGAIGTVKDRLYRDGTDWKLRKAVEKDFVLDGSVNWGASTILSTMKKFMAANPVNISTAISQTLTKHDGFVLRLNIGNIEVQPNTFYPHPNGSFYVNVSNTDTGFGETYIPTSAEIKAYFNGWKANVLAPTTNQPTAWVSVVDGSAAPTQTLAYVSTTKAANYTPYKLSYVLATPVTEIVNNKVEGDISVNGLTQVEVGAGVVFREDVKPGLAGNFFIFNNAYPGLASSKFSNKAEKIVAIYKNGMLNSDWTVLTGHPNGNGKVYAEIPVAKYDANARYSATYIVYEKEKFTTAPVNVLATYANNVRTALEDTVQKTEDNTTNISINSMILYDVIRRLKAGGL